MTQNLHYFGGGQGFTVNPVPYISTMRLTPADRAIGWLVEVQVNNTPVNVSQIDLIGDVFHKLYSGPAMREDELPASRQINQLLLNWIATNEHFISALEYTRGNILSSLSASGVLWQMLIKDETINKVLDEQKEAEKAEQEARQAMNRLAKEAMDDYGRQGGRQDGQHGGQNAQAASQASLQAAQQKQREARKHSESAMANALALMEKLQNNPLMQGMASNMSREMEQNAEKVSALCRTWGIEPGDIKFDDATKVLKLLKSINFERLSELVGRMKIASGKAMEATVQSWTGQITEATLTHDIAHLFPTERAYISQAANPVIRGMKIHSLVAGGGLLGWQNRGEGKESGGFIGMVDKSSSMTDRNDNMTPAKAIALGVALSLKEKSKQDGAERYFEITPFDGDVVAGLCVTSDDAPLQLFAFASLQASGGTDFHLALNYAVKRLKVAQDRGVKGLDILFITDGQCRVDDAVVAQVKKAKEETHARIIYVQIGGSPDDFQGMADTVILVKPNDFSSDAEGVTMQIASAIARHELEGYEKEQ